LFDFEDLGVGDEGFFRLFALFIEDTEVEPDLAHGGVEGGGFDDVVEGVRVVGVVVVEDGQSRPVRRLPRVLVRCLLEILQSLFRVLQAHVASSKYVMGVCLSLVFLFSFLDIFQGRVNISLKEV